MTKQYGYFEWDDESLRPGNKQEGGWHQNLYDENGKLKGNARFIPEEEPYTGYSSFNEEEFYYYKNYYENHEHQEYNETKLTPEEQELAEALLKLILCGVAIAVTAGFKATRKAILKARNRLHTRKSKKNKNLIVNENLHSKNHTNITPSVEVEISNKKYVLTAEQYENLLKIIQNHHAMINIYHHILNKSTIIHPGVHPNLQKNRDNLIIDGEIIDRENNQTRKKPINSTKKFQGYHKK